MKKGWHWPVILGALAAVVIGANLILAFVAHGDPSFAVEPDYYGKALAWDDKREQDRRNVELGWTLTFGLAAKRSPDGTLRLSARLFDRDGEELTDAAIAVDAFHNARASLILHADLRHEPESGYSAGLPVRRPGLWEFRFEVLREGQRFTHTAVQEVGWR